MKANSASPVDVFGFGHCCLDYLTVFDKYPQKGKKGEVIRSLVVGGGPVPTALATLARFGASVRFCGKVGEDSDGARIIEDFRSSGVDMDWMLIDPDVRSARAFIWIDGKTGERTVALDLTRFSFLEESDLEEELIRKCRIFLCDGRAPGATLKGLRIARKAKITTVLDSGSARPGLTEILPLIDFAIVSKDFADSYSPGASAGDLAHKLVEGGAVAAIVTVGEDGAIYDNGRSQVHIPSFNVETFDTTGAGDVFHGAFIYGLLQDWNPQESIRFANAAAALSCRTLSGLKSIPDLGEIEKLIAKA